MTIQIQLKLQLDFIEASLAFCEFELIENNFYPAIIRILIDAIPAAYRNGLDSSTYHYYQDRLSFINNAFFNYSLGKEV